jgi:hypothetical protein
MLTFWASMRKLTSIVPCVLLKVLFGASMLEGIVCYAGQVRRLVMRCCSGR